jgi:hypothetical protein
LICSQTNQQQETDHGRQTQVRGKPTFKTLTYKNDEDDINVFDYNSDNDGPITKKRRTKQTTDDQQKKKYIKEAEKPREPKLDTNDTDEQSITLEEHNTVTVAHKYYTVDNDSMDEETQSDEYDADSDSMEDETQSDKYDTDSDESWEEETTNDELFNSALQNVRSIRSDLLSTDTRDRINTFKSTLTSFQTPDLISMYQVKGVKEQHKLRKFTHDKPVGKQHIRVCCLINGNLRFFDPSNKWTQSLGTRKQVELANKVKTCKFPIVQVEDIEQIKMTQHGNYNILCEHDGFVHVYSRKTDQVSRGVKDGHNTSHHKPVLLTC